MFAIILHRSPFATFFFMWIVLHALRTNNIVNNPSTTSKANMEKKLHSNPPQCDRICLRCTHLTYLPLHLPCSSVLVCFIGDEREDFHLFFLLRSLLNIDTSDSAWNAQRFEFGSGPTQKSLNNSSSNINRLIWATDTCTERMCHVSILTYYGIIIINRFDVMPNPLQNMKGTDSHFDCNSEFAMHKTWS